MDLHYKIDRPRELGDLALKKKKHHEHFISPPVTTYVRPNKQVLKVTVKLLHIITYTYTYTTAKKMNHYTYRPIVLTHAYKIIKYQSTIGIGDGGQGGHVPPKNCENIFRAIIM